MERFYTKSQKRLIDKLRGMIGKKYDESSIKTEMNKCLARGNWNAIRTADGLAVSSVVNGMVIEVQFKNQFDSRTRFRLHSVSHTPDV